MKLESELFPQGESHDRVRSLVYSGRVFIVPALQTSSLLIREIEEIVATTCRVPTLSQIRKEIDNEQLLLLFNIARRRVTENERVRTALITLLEGLGFRSDETAIDDIRLRCITSDGHTKPQARAAYYAHRDTWYGNPQAQINWWIPLDDYNEEQTFWFYPVYFNRAVPNDSSMFDYSVFRSAVGWQGQRKEGIKSEQHAVYPRSQIELPREEAREFSLKKGEILIFSGAHLHQTRPNLSLSPRISIDFRTVHWRDHIEGTGAPNLDNKSRGSSLEDFPHRPVLHYKEA